MLFIITTTTIINHHHHQPSSESPSSSSVIIIIVIISHNYHYFAILPLLVLAGGSLNSFTSDYNWLACLASFTLSHLPQILSFTHGLLLRTFLLFLHICLTLLAFKCSLPKQSLKKERKEVCCPVSETLQYYLMDEEYSAAPYYLVNECFVVRIQFPPSVYHYKQLHNSSQSSLVDNSNAILKT